MTIKDYHKDIKRKLLSFKVSEGEKNEIENYASQKSLATASLCRFLILEKIREGAENE